MSEPGKDTVTRLIDLASLTPPPLHVREDREGVRVRYLAFNNGTGLQIGKAFYQVKHACGQWAWAQSPYCQHCGQPVDLAPEIKAAVFPDPDKRPDTAPSLRDRPEPPEAPLGSFNNPAPGPRPREAPPDGFNADPVAAAAAQAVLSGRRVGGMVTAVPPDDHGKAPAGPARPSGARKPAGPPAEPADAPRAHPGPTETDEDEGDDWDEELDRILEEEEGS